MDTPSSNGSALLGSMVAGQPDREFSPSPQFVFRTPLLPFDELLALGEGLTAARTGAADELEDAIAADCERVRHRLRGLLERPEIREAIFIASPSLHEQLPQWLNAPDTEQGQKVERALVRYVSRMASRATPFGLFSAVSLGRIGTRTRLSVVGREHYRRSTRLDNDYLYALAAELRRDPRLRDVLRYRPNSSAYSIAGRIHYAETKVVGRARSHDLVAVDAEDYLLATLARAQQGATRAELAAGLLADDSDIEPLEAEAFVDEVIEAGLLEADLEPPVTGREPLDAMLERLRAIDAPQNVVEPLDDARREIQRLDAAPLGSAHDAYQRVAEHLRRLPPSFEQANLLQVDMFKPGPEATLGGAVLEEIERGVRIMLGLTHTSDPLRRFKQAFEERYGDREVPLVEALDDEAGVGFESTEDPATIASPLLAGLPWPGSSGARQLAWTDRETALLRLLERAWARGDHQIELTERDLEQLRPPETASLPTAFAVIAQIAAESAEAADAGRFRVLLDGAGGPPGVRTWGRFCHGNPEIREAVEAHLRQEEALAPHAVFAEVAHVPEGRLGNVLCRPVLRGYEIPYLGVSGADASRQIALTDLSISVYGGRVHLRSRSLDCEVIPRTTTAHNYAAYGLGIYKFLCELQSQDGGAFGFTWEPFSTVAFVPRLTHGRLVLSRAKWRLDAAELATLARAFDRAKSVPARRASVFAAVQVLRADRRLPRLVVLADRDNELLIDLDNPLDVASFVQLVRRRSTCQLVESFCGPDELLARGPEGRFRHELSVSFVRSAPLPATARPRECSTVRRRFGPGTEWLYAKIYAGSVSADELIRQVVAPVARRAIDERLIDRWFFIRYADPGRHLRVRFHGAASGLHETVLPRLVEALAPWEDAGLVHDVQLDTYDREVDRYGGDAGIELCEAMFWHDSEAIVDLLETLEGDAGFDARWRLALRGTDRLLDDLELDLAAKHDVMRNSADGLAREFRVDMPFTRQLGMKFRAHREDLEQLFDRDAVHDPMSPIAVFDRRSERWASVVAELRARSRRGDLTRTLPDVGWSLVHMQNNRLLRSAHRAHELVLYDLLARHYKSRLARSRRA